MYISSRQLMKLDLLEFFIGIPSSLSEGLVISLKSSQNSHGVLIWVVVFLKLSHNIFLCIVVFLE